MNSLIIKGFLALSFSSFIVYSLLSSNLSINELKKVSIEKMTSSILDDLDRAMPLINQAGYKVFSIQAQLSLPPKVNAIFELDKSIDKKKQKIILEALDDNVIGKLVLSSLIQAFSIDESISIRKMDLTKINIAIALPPSVTVDYR